MTSRSRRSASGVKEKCIRDQGKVRQGPGISALVVTEKCVRGQGELHQGSRRSASLECVVFSWSTSPWPLTYFSLTSGALLLDPWRTSPWPLTHFSLTWRAYFSELKTAKNWWKKNPIIFLKTLYIFKYSYALVVKT